MEGIYGGMLFVVCGNGFVMFWDWEIGLVVRRIEVDVISVSWSVIGNFVVIIVEDLFYVFLFNREVYDVKLDSGELIGDEGVEEVFEVIVEISEM